MADVAGVVTGESLREALVELSMIVRSKAGESGEIGRCSSEKKNQGLFKSEINVLYYSNAISQDAASFHVMHIQVHLNYSPRPALCSVLRPLANHV